MAQYTYPGVYIEEVPSGVRTITGVATSITAFVGYTRKGEPDKAVMISSFPEFERLYGGLDRESPLSYAVSQFYMNGGTQAIIVRVAAGFQTASQELSSGNPPTPVLEVKASSPGKWGDKIYIKVEHAETRNPYSDFNLIVLREQGEGGSAQKIVQEIHRNLSMNSKSADFVESVVNTSSKLIHVKRKSLTFSKKGYAVSKSITFPVVGITDRLITGVVDGDLPFRIELSADPADMAGLLAQINTSLNSQRLDTVLSVSECGIDGGVGTGHIKLESSRTASESSTVSINGSGYGSLVANIGMGTANGGREYTAASEHRPDVIAESRMTTHGSDGSKASATELIGTEDPKTGMQVLQDVELFNLLVVPETFDMNGSTDADKVVQKGIVLCEKKRAFYIVDPPSAKTRADIATWANGMPSRDAAVYFPAVNIADPLDKLRTRMMAASGTLAGVYARTDAQRGVWKAPAGTDAVLKGVDSVTVNLNDIENGTLNQKGVNVLRAFSAYGKVAWGARTMKGSDAQADEYKYIPIRRLALYIEESLYRGTQWVVFEPNDEPLWAQIRLNIGAFMHGLFRQGAFQGSSPRDAYFVKCDGETTTQSDRNLGIVNIFVGFAPLKPAEFVVIKIQQIAGQIEV
jgi:phage tail sheath protein FI